MPQATARTGKLDQLMGDLMLVSATPQTLPFVLKLVYRLHKSTGPQDLHPGWLMPQRLPLNALRRDICPKLLLGTLGVHI